MARRKTFAERFWPRVNKTDGCWLWVGGKNQDGYGVYFGGVPRLLAHKESYRHLVGEIPVGMCVLHRCDVPLCVNPDHLFLGTRAANAHDRNEKGRTSRESRNVGRDHPHALLNEEKAVEIVLLRRGGEDMHSIAARFGVGYDTVRSVVNGKRWQHATGGVR
jgi:hypothetical protein